MADDLKGMKVAILATDGVERSSSSSRGERCTVRALPVTCYRSIPARSRPGSQT